MSERRVVGEVSGSQLAELRLRRDLIGRLTARITRQEEDLAEARQLLAIAKSEMTSFATATVRALQITQAGAMVDPETGMVLVPAEEADPRLVAAGMETT
jgi:hypothetical protein